MKKPWLVVKSEVKGLAWLSVGLFLLVSLITYDSSDRVLFENFGTVLRPVQNACGHFGAFLAVLGFKILGYASYGLVAISLVQSIRGFKSSKGSIESYALGFLTLILTSVSFHLYWNDIFLVSEVNPGGWTGLILSENALRAFNKTGTFLVVLFSYLILIALVFENPIKKSYEFIGRVFQKVNQSNTILKFLGACFRNLNLPRLRLGLSFKFWRGHHNNNIDSSVGSSHPELRSTTVGFSQTSADGAAKISIDKDSEGDDLVEQVPLNPIVKMALIRRQNQKEESYKIESFKRDKTLKVNFKVKDEDWEMPSLDLLNDPPSQFEGMSEDEIREKSNLLVSKLEQFSVRGKIVGVKSGPAVTLFEFRPNADIKISKITELADDLSLALASESVRIIAPIPGRDVVGIETSNSARDTVFIKDIVARTLSGKKI